MTGTSFVISSASGTIDAEEENEVEKETEAEPAEEAEREENEEFNKFAVFVVREEGLGWQ